MTTDTLRTAIAEAQRFIIAAQAASWRIKEDGAVLIVGSKETAAAKRASMDLTRALAAMRRS
ncbi:MAG: hypothetical protein Q8R28_10665 [Dehalococcoidia bacterium]|nr:hypothetical protein [Dehalococcoidia bacterium]